MARTRYDNCVTRIEANAQARTGRTFPAGVIDRALTLGIAWFESLHPTAWPWQIVNVEIDAATESLEIVKSDGTAGTLWGTNPTPRINGIQSVLTQVGASTGRWRALQGKEWKDMVMSASFYRSVDGGTSDPQKNQTIWSEKHNHSGVAASVGTITLETYPYTYGGTNAQKLYCNITYIRDTPTVAVGTNADDAFLWSEIAWDYVPSYLAEAMLAHQINNFEAFESAMYLARLSAKAALIQAQVPSSRIELPPPFILRQAHTSEAGG